MMPNDYRDFFFSWSNWPFIYLCKVICSTLLLVFVLLLLSFRSVSYTPDPSPLSDIHFANIFSVCGLPIHFLNGIFDVHKLLILITSHLSFKFFLVIASFMFKKSLPISKLQRYSRLFPKCFIIFAFMFRSAMHIKVHVRNGTVTIIP